MIEFGSADDNPTRCLISTDFYVFPMLLSSWNDDGALGVNSLKNHGSGDRGGGGQKCIRY